MRWPSIEGSAANFDFKTMFLSMSNPEYFNASLGMNF